MVLLELFEYVAKTCAGIDASVLVKEITGRFVGVGGPFRDYVGDELDVEGC